MNFSGVLDAAICWAKISDIWLISNLPRFLSGRVTSICVFEMWVIIPRTIIPDEITDGENFVIGIIGRRADFDCSFFSARLDVFFEGPRGSSSSSLIRINTNSNS